jgi:hypothetical protein
MKTIMIDLKQFPTNYKECNWLRGLISLASDYFKKEVFADRLWLETKANQDYDYDLDVLCEASSVDFKYKIVNGSIEEIKSLLK